MIITKKFILKAHVNFFTVCLLGLLLGVTQLQAQEVGQGRIERSVPGGLTASETFDIGVDFGSPVALDYFDRAPFRFNGKIEKIHIKYID